MALSADQIAETTNRRVRRLQSQIPGFQVNRVTLFMGRHVLIAIRADRVWCKSLHEEVRPGKPKLIEFMGLTVEILEAPEDFFVAYEA